jgi:Polyphosphate kinase 2 (PPK2)
LRGDESWSCAPQSSTDHPAAPWRVIAAESKHYARVAVLETVISSIEQALRAVGQEPVGIEAVV